MPKISPIKGHNDSSFQVQGIPTRNFSKMKEEAPEPIIRTKHVSLHDSVVPIYEVNYDPQFSKSPLASVEMSRKQKSYKYAPVLAQVYEEPEDLSHVLKRQNFEYDDEQKSDWKSILCWVGIGLGIIAFGVGLYFLVDAIMGRSSPRVNNDANNQGGIYTSGITPIYVNPIPYNSLSAFGPSNSVSSAPIENPEERYTSGTTFPSVLPNSNSQTLTANQTRQPAPLKPDSSKVETINTPTTKPQGSTKWGIDPQENSIEPINAYEKFTS